MSKEGNRSPQTDFPRSTVCLFPFPTVGYPPGRAAQQRSQRVHDDVVHLASSQTVTVLQIFNSRRRKARQHDRDGDGQLPFPQHERQGQPDGEKQQNISASTGTVPAALWPPGSSEMEQAQLPPFLPLLRRPSYRRSPPRSRQKRPRCEYPPPPAALFPVPQISPQNRRQDHEDHDPVQRLYINQPKKFIHVFSVSQYGLPRFPAARGGTEIRSS